jgi:hypothetical protein
MKKLSQIFSLLQKRFTKLSPVFHAVEVQLESVGICLQIGHQHQPTQPSKKLMSNHNATENEWQADAAVASSAFRP